ECSGPGGSAACTAAGAGYQCIPRMDLPGVAANYCAPVTQAPVNVALMATATASTEDVANGQTADKAIDGVIDGYPGDSTKEWARVGEGAGGVVDVEWLVPQSIGKPVSFDRPNLSDQVPGGSVTFRGGRSVALTALNNDGTATTFPFAPKMVTSLTVNISS